MFNSAILEVIIGLIFVFSLLSILVTQINTVITNLLNTRAKHLKNGIEDLITDPVVAAKFMSHPLIQLIPLDQRAMPQEQISAQTAENVSRRQPFTVNTIPATLFSQVLFDIVAANAAHNLYKPLFEAVERSLDGAEEARAREMVRRLQGSSISMDELRAYFNTLPPVPKQSLMLTLDRTAKAQSVFNSDDTDGKLIPLLEGIRYIQDPFFQKAMDTLLATAKSVEEAAVKVEGWFDTRMGQLSDTYKRNIQYLSLLIGLLLALFLNVDTLHVARTLWDDPYLRSAIADTATASLESGELQRQLEESRRQLQDAQATLSAPPADPMVTPAPIDPNAPIDAQTAQQAEAPNATDEVRESIDNLLSLRLPVGWVLLPVEGGCFTDAVNAAECRDPRNLWNFLPGNNPDGFGIFIRKIIGIIITMIAVAQGAPFWFDLLNRLAHGGSRS
jgi:hypothetical protein